MFYYSLIKNYEYFANNTNITHFKQASYTIVLAEYITKYVIYCGQNTVVEGL